MDIAGKCVPLEKPHNIKAAFDLETQPVRIGLDSNAFNQLKKISDYTSLIIVESYRGKVDAFILLALQALVSFGASLEEKD